MANFRIVRSAAVWWPVIWQEAADGGGVEECRIEVKFKRLTISQFKAFETKEIAEVLAEVALDWRGIDDDAGRPVPFTPEAVAQLLDMPNLPSALAIAWGRCFAAMPETRLGNSGPSPAGGPAAMTEPTAEAPITPAL